MEFGYQSFPSQNTVDFFTQGKQQNVTSPIMEHHQRNPAGNSKIVEMFTRYFRFPATFEDFIYLSQLQQALIIKTGVEYWRTLQPVCMGTLYWQLNDNWPVASWSSVDYFGNWKQLHYHAKRFYAPVMATVIRKTPETVEVRIVSDLGKKVCGKITLSLYKVTGELVSQRVIPLELAEYEAKILETIPLAELTDTPNEEFLYLEFSDGKNTFTNECFLAKYKTYQLPQARIDHKFYLDEQGQIHLELTSDKPAFYVFAELRGIQATFSDNSFTLLPGTVRDLIVTPEKNIPLEEMEKLLTVKHLRNSYTE